MRVLTAMGVCDEVGPQSYKANLVTEAIAKEGFSNGVKFVCVLLALPTKQSTLADISIAVLTAECLHWPSLLSFSSLITTKIQQTRPTRRLRLPLALLSSNGYVILWLSFSISCLFLHLHGLWIRPDPSLV